MKIVLATEPPQSLAADCLDQGLYVPGWILKGVLEEICTGSSIDIVVAYDEAAAVGVMTLTDTQFGTFVKPEYRRKGIGSLLYREMQKYTRRKYENICMRIGLPGSVEFFQKLKHPTIDNEP